MALKARCDRFALSLGVEIDSDGAIDSKSIIVTPSIIHVDYRLSYDETDEMLEEGVGYSEEWELGDMLNAAQLRRSHRIANGSTEGLITQMPSYSLKVKSNDSEEDLDMDVELTIESQSNSGRNATMGAVDSTSAKHVPEVSSSNLLVTEMMILSGEAMGKFGMLVNANKSEDKDVDEDEDLLLELPYRSQQAPDIKSRPEEWDIFKELSKKQIGNGYCASWYMRRFFRPVSVSSDASPHKAMGLDCYVQWSSPIRRYGDLQVHAAIKRYLRRTKIKSLLEQNLDIPKDVPASAIGMNLSALITPSKMGTKALSVDPINFDHGLALIRASRPMARSSNQYWLYEYLRRQLVSINGAEEEETNNENSNITNKKEVKELVFECVVLGMADPNRLQYAIFVHELGLEHRYSSEKGELNPGETLWLKVQSVNPRMSQLTFSLASNKNGFSS
jgi:hypothetical protein